ncbi:MCE family protein [Marinobacter pelagius]|uniref:MlaD family protein n=1 Tax=Marinobacter sp. C7 TaxID=2951363 RepID=UPI001EF0E6E2|nr:MlaD family protein [Marinobacter sp. C7]MCG7199750.1 MCE family protein [Marinobacter sp. C7]
MEPRAHHVIIGLFTVLAVGAALIFALWLGKSSADREWAYYQIRFDHPISGLSEGNPVLYSGVPVGEVLDLTLDPENPSHVRVLVRVDQEVPIRKDTHVGLILANITGSMSVQFRGGTRESPVLQGDRNNPPVINADPSAFSSLLTNGQALIEKTETLLTSANNLFSEKNMENISSILENTRAATDSLLAQREKLLALMEQFDAAGTRAEEAALKVSDVSDNANAILLDKVAPVLDSMDQALSSLQPTLTRLDDLTRTNAGALDAGLQGLGELTPAIRELRSALRNLNQFAHRLEANPAGTLLGGSDIKEVDQ